MIDNEILGATFRFIQGVDCSREAIGLDAFREAGHSSKFLELDHTLRHLRKERWEPRLTNRASWDKWLSSTGGKDMRERAREQVKKILVEHHPSYVSEKEAKEIDRIAVEAKQVLSKRTDDSG